MNLFTRLISYLFKKFCLESHKFKPSALIFRSGTRTLFEVDSNYYNKDLEPVTIVRTYPLGKQNMGISKHEIMEFQEYKGLPSETLGMTSNDNDKFANYKKSKK